MDVMTFMKNIQMTMEDVTKKRSEYKSANRNIEKGKYLFSLEQHMNIWRDLFVFQYVHGSENDKVFAFRGLDSVAKELESIIGSSVYIEWVYAGHYDEFKKFL